MTTMIKNQLDRIQYLLQENDTTDVNRRSIINTQHQDETTRLSRRQLWGEVVWLQGLAGTAQYTLPTSTIAIRLVLYDERMIAYASEEMLDSLDPGWEATANEPQFWTTDNQNPNVIRLVPPPLRDGSAIPLSPGLPVMQAPAQNLLIFLYEDRAGYALNESNDFPLPDVWEDVLVYEAAAELASRESETQNFPLAVALRALSKVYLQALGVTR